MPDDEAAARLRASPPHVLLARMAGSWAGEIRTWFQPGVLADTSPVEGEVRLVLGGRFAVHDYRATFQGAPFHGMAIHGYDRQRRRWVTAWVDENHNDTAIMTSVGGAWDEAAAAGGAPQAWSVLGSYPDGRGGPDWGWRTEVDVSGAPERLVVTHFNVTPAGAEAKGVEFTYVRRGAP